MTRNIKGIYSSRKVNMDGSILDQPLPQPGLEDVDPFILIHYWNRPLKGNQNQKDTGVGPHPHRGFSPVTIIFKGAVHHRDSRGNNSIVKEGGAQWMNAGMGIIHSERPEKNLAEQGGHFEIIQFWVNTPAAYKMNEPGYFPVNALIYVLDGKLLLNNSFTIGEKQMAVFKDNGDVIEIQCKEDSRALLLAGEPVNEDIVKSGPFVMNTHTEIMEAMRDYQIGKMGILIED